MFMLRLWMLVNSRAVGADGPDAVHLVPRPFVAEHQQVRIGGRKLQMIQPVVAAVEIFHFAGLKVVEKQFHRQVFFEPFLDVPGLVFASRVGIGCELSSRARASLAWSSFMIDVVPASKVSSEFTALTR